MLVADTQQMRIEADELLNCIGVLSSASDTILKASRAIDTHTEMTDEIRVKMLKVVQQLSIEQHQLNQLGRALEEAACLYDRCEKENERKCDTQPAVQLHRLLDFPIAPLLL